MKIKINKRLVVSLGAISLVVIVIFSLSSMESKTDEKNTSAVTRVRREQIPKSKLSTKTVVTNTVTTKSVSSGNPIALPTVDFIPGVAYKDATTIQSVFNEQVLCSILKINEVQNMLAMTTEPIPKYFFSQTQGAKCVYNNGEGEEVSVQFSTTSFANARIVDSALSEISENIILSNGAYGVAKENNANGYTLSLNLFGVDQNEVLVSAPTETTAESIAVTISDYLKTNPL